MFSLSITFTEKEKVTQATLPNKEEPDDKNILY